MIIKGQTLLEKCLSYCFTECSLKCSNENFNFISTDIFKTSMLIFK